MVTKPLEVAIGWIRMVLLPVVKLSTACVCPSGFTTVIAVGDTCGHKSRYHQGVRYLKDGGEQMGAEKGDALNQMLITASIDNNCSWFV